MDASDLIRELPNSLRGAGRPHMGGGPHSRASARLLAVEKPRVRGRSAQVVGRFQAGNVVAVRRNATASLCDRRSRRWRLDRVSSFSARGLLWHGPRRFARSGRFSKRDASGIDEKHHPIRGRVTRATEKENNNRSARRGKGSSRRLIGDALSARIPTGRSLTT